MGSVSFVRAGRVGFAYFMTHTIGADGVAAEASPKQMLAEALRARLERQGRVR